MRSGTSFFDWTVFKKTIARFWPLWGAYFAIWLVDMPLNGLMLLRMISDPFSGEASSYIETFAQVTVTEKVQDALALAVVFGVLAAMAVFSHLYSPRSANLFGSLPVRREGLFLTHYLAGLAFLIVPNVAVFLLTLAVEAAGGCLFMQGLWFWLAASCGECFLFYSMAVFCAMFTGHILALPAFYAVLNFLAIGVTSLVQMLLMAFLYGYRDYEVSPAVVWLTPAANLSEAVGRVWEGGSDDRVMMLFGWDVLGLYALAALALSVCAFLLYRARRLESAGDVVSVRAMRPVFKYGVAFCAGLALGVGTTFFTGGGEITLMTAMVVWGVIGYFAAQMLLDKSFRVFGKWKGAAAVVGVFAAAFLAVGLDLTGYETRIPDPAGVQEVYVWTNNAVRLGDDGDWRGMTVSDPEVIRLISILHREAVAQRDTQAQPGSVSTTLDVRYTLGGGTLSRRYTVFLDPDEMDQEGTAAWAVQQMYDNHALYWEVYGFAAMEKALAEGGRLDTVSLELYDGRPDGWGVTGDVIGYGKDAQALLAAVKEDFFAGRIGVRRLDDEEHWYGGTPETSLYFSATDREAGQGAYSIHIALQDTASSTIGELRRLEASLDDRELRGALEAWLK